MLELKGKTLIFSDGYVSSGKNDLIYRGRRTVWLVTFDVWSLPKNMIKFSYKEFKFRNFLLGMQLNYEP